LVMISCRPALSVPFTYSHSSNTQTAAHT
jgi:hypothetical protein